MISPQLSPSGTYLNIRDNLWLLAIGRLKVTFEQAHADARNIAAQLAKDYPQTNKQIGGPLLTVSAADFLPENVRRTFLWESRLSRQAKLGKGGIKHE